MHGGKFGTAINCMDGRVQLPIIDWLKQNYALDYVDMITEPGPEGVLTRGTGAQQDSIKARVLISVNAHGSDTILIAGHHDCAGNPVAKEEHRRQIIESVKLIRSWGLPVRRVIGVWVNESWTVETVEVA
ncbi:MAG: hypothetical protein NTU41_03915 [Chloroflexi bacterium]|nr:hypothetical protein [Chloroflexota bacterium]